MLRPDDEQRLGNRLRIGQQHGDCRVGTVGCRTVGRWAASAWRIVAR